MSLCQHVQEINAVDAFQRKMFIYVVRSNQTLPGDTESCSISRYRGPSNGEAHDDARQRLVLVARKSAHWWYAFGGSFPTNNWLLLICYASWLIQCVARPPPLVFVPVQAVSADLQYDTNTIEEFNVDSKSEYSALSSTRSQRKKLKQPTSVPLWYSTG